MQFNKSLFHIIAAPVLTDAEATYVVRLDPAHVIFQAHFPGEPIMPGACITQMIQEVVSQWRQCDLQLVKVNNLKFLSIIRPDELPELEIRIQLTRQDVDQVQVKGSLTAAETDYTKYSLTFARNV